MRTAKAALPLARGGIHLACCSRHRLELVAHLVEQSPEPLPFLMERLVRTGFPRLAALIGARIATSYRLGGSLLEDLDDVCSMPLLGGQRGSVAFWRRGVLAGVPPRAIRRLPPVSSTRFVGQPSPTVSCNAAPSISPEGVHWVRVFRGDAGTSPAECRIHAEAAARNGSAAWGNVATCLARRHRRAFCEQA
jgi:hypothetical protein